MNYPCVFRETYKSKLGLLELMINANGQSVQVTDKNKVLVTTGHTVVMKKVTPAFDWLPKGMHVESAIAWLFYITKRNAVAEQLSFSIALEAIDSTVECGSATGQYLIAIELENGIRQMHIGTEDEDAMAYRASIRDYMPARFETLLSKYEIEISTINSCGLGTQTPALELGEQFYFHYVVAENPYLLSADYPSETDASTWFAVEQSKKQLEQTCRAQSYIAGLKQNSLFIHRLPHV